jgi:hypothetical protein
VSGCKSPVVATASEAPSTSADATEAIAIRAPRERSIMRTFTSYRE